MTVERYQGVAQGDGPDVKETAEKKSEVIAAKEQARNLVPVEAQANGMLIGKSLDEEYRIAKALCASRILPKAYDTPEKVFAARQLCFELGLRPMTGLRQIAVINGTPSMFGDLPLAIVRASKQLESFREFFIDAKGNEISYQNKNLEKQVWGAVCILKRKGMTEDTRVFTLDDAKMAKLLPADAASPWTKYQRRMLQMRTRSWNLKDNFGDFLNGVAIAEYDLNELPEASGPERAKDITPTLDLNEAFGVVQLSKETIVPENDIEFSKMVKDRLDAQMKDIEPPKTDESPEETKPEYVMPIGLFAGMTLSQVPKSDLSSYYLKLRKKKLTGELSEELVSLMAQIESYLEGLPK